jgi:hypothetical protein
VLIFNKKLLNYAKNVISIAKRTEVYNCVVRHLLFLFSGDLLEMHMVVIHGRYIYQLC